MSETRYDTAKEKLYNHMRTRINATRRMLHGLTLDYGLTYIQSRQLYEDCLKELLARQTLKSRESAAGFLAALADEGAVLDTEFKTRGVEILKSYGLDEDKAAALFGEIDRETPEKIREENQKDLEAFKRYGLDAGHMIDFVYKFYGIGNIDQ